MTIGALAYIAATSAKNRVVGGIKRLRNARYLLSTLAAGAYYYYFMFHRTAMIRGPRHTTTFVGLPPNELGLQIASAMVFLLLVVPWGWPTDKGGTEFTEAEVQFLFPAPLRRWQLLLYKFFRSQLQLLFSTVMMMIFVARGGNVVGMWLFMGAVTLYMTMVGQLRARLRRIGIGPITRGVVVLAFLAVVLWWFTHHGFLHAPGIAALLALPRLLASALMPHIALSTRILGAAALIGVGIVSFLIAAAANVSFEEGSLELAQRKSRRAEGVRLRHSGQWVAFKRLPPPFRLGDRGAPEIAIYWKNLIASLRIGAPIMLAFLGPMIILSAETFFYPDVVGDVAGAVFVATACILPLLGSRAFAQDLRLDINRMDFLKTFPVSTDRLVAAELAAPLTVSAALELILLTFTAVFFATHASTLSLARFVNANTLTIAFLFAIPLCALQLILGNAAVLLFPAWTLRSKEEPRGFLMIGQRLIVMVGNLILLCTAILPAGVLLVPALIVAHRFFVGSPAFMAIVTMPSVAVLVAEVWIGVKLLAGWFETFDPSSELDRVLA
jgi:ABC-2 type transport system permease protein